jgi:hypothetical protein
VGKRRYCIVLEEKTIKSFKAHIMRKTGDLKKGDLSKWIETIIKNSIREEHQQHQHTSYNQHAMSKEEEMISTLTELMKDISSHFWKLDNPFPFRCGIDIHKKTLKTAISEVRGHDYRTTKKWFDRLLEFGFIRRARNNEYKIFNDGHESYDVKVEPKPEPKQEISTEQKQQEFDSVMEQLK